LLAHSVGMTLSSGAVIESVALKILLPLVLGQLLRPILSPDAGSPSAGRRQWWSETGAPSF
jgi:predicted Na+-dependent transporter